MAKNDNIIDFLGDVADAIREKKGISEPIAAQDFADEIKGIKTDGMRYFDFRGFDNNEPGLASSLIKVYDDGWFVIITPSIVLGHPMPIGAIAVDDRKLSFGDGNLISIFDWAKDEFGIDIEATFPEITEEEFYDLTWEVPEEPEG